MKSVNNLVLFQGYIVIIPVWLHVILLHPARQHPAVQRLGVQRKFIALHIPPWTEKDRSFNKLLSCVFETG